MWEKLSRSIRARFIAFISIVIPPRVYLRTEDPLLSLCVIRALKKFTARKPAGKSWLFPVRKIRESHPITPRSSFSGQFIKVGDTVLIFKEITAFEGINISNCSRIAKHSAGHPFERYGDRRNDSFQAFLLRRPTSKTVFSV